MKRLLITLFGLLCFQSVYADYHVSIASGNWDGTTTWGTVANIPTMHATTNVTITNSDKFTATFTAPNTTSSVKGCMFYSPAIGTQNWVLNLQENTIDVAVATMTVTSREIGWTYISFATPFTYTATTAGYYRFKLRTVSASGTGTVAADSGGTNIAFWAVDNRPEYPIAGDNVFIVSDNNENNKIVTLNGTQYVGISTNTTAIPVIREMTDAIVISTRCVLNYDLTASATMYVRGNIVVQNGGMFNIGTSALPYTSTCTAKIIFQPVVSGDFGISCFNGGYLQFYGSPVMSASTFSTLITSGTGTSSNPLVVASSVNWRVGDEILITPSTGYASFDERWINQVISGNQYVLMSSTGGIVPFNFSHSTASWAINTTRNIVITTTNTLSLAFYTKHVNTVEGNIAYKWTRLENCGVNATDKYGMAGCGYYTFKSNVDYCYFNYGWQLFYMLYPINNNTFEGNISYKSLSYPLQLTNHTGTTNTKSTFNDWFFLAPVNYSIYALAFNYAEFNRCHWIGNGQSAAANCIYAASANNAFTFNDCEFNSNRGYALGFYGSETNFVFNNANIGTNGAQTFGVFDWAAGYIDIFLNTPLLNTSQLLINNYVGMPPGAKVSFANFNGVTGDNRWYTGNGYFNSTGAGLTDNTVRTSGTNNVKMFPTDASNGLSWSFQILASSASAIYCQGFLQKTVLAAGTTVTVSLYLPYATTPASVYTMTSNTGIWELFNVSANYTGTTSSLATVTINAKGTTGSIYVADIFNGTNDITNLTTWINGQPSTIMFQQLGDPLAVWSVPTSGFTTTGTAGKYFMKIGVDADASSIPR